MIKKNQHLAVRWSFQAAGSKVKHRCHLFAAQVEPFDNVLYAGASLEIFENRRDRHPRSAEDPRPADFPGYALDGRAL